jgi:predicted nucleic acid-binding protein
VTRVAVVFDTSALLSYSTGVAAGELIAEVADEHRLVGVPALCLAEAYADADDPHTTRQLDRLVTIDAVAVLPLRADQAREIGHYAAQLVPWAVGQSIPIAAAVAAALEYEAYYASATPKLAARILPAGWPILDLLSGA